MRPGSAFGGHVFLGGFAPRRVVGIAHISFAAEAVFRAYCERRFPNPSDETARGEARNEWGMTTRDLGRREDRPMSFGILESRRL